MLEFILRRKGSMDRFCCIIFVLLCGNGSCDTICIFCGMCSSKFVSFNYQSLCTQEEYD
eukprot:UN03835